MSLLFEFLFKYRAYFYEKGDVAFRPPWPWYVTCLLAAAIIAAGLLIDRRTSRRLPPRWRVALAGLRILSLGIILFLLLRPVLILNSAVPQRSFVAIAYDASRSMTIADGPRGRRRLDVQADLLRQGPGSLSEALQRRFRLRYFSFSGGAQRQSAYGEISRPGDVTGLARSLDQIAAELGNAPVSGVILLTDGADTQGEDLAPVLARMRAKKISIYTVGIGSAGFAQDVEVSRVEAPRRVLQDSIIEADVVIRSTGLAGRRARLQAVEGERILQSQDIVLSGDEELRSHRIAFASGAAGDRIYSIRVLPLAGEVVAENNEQRILVRVLDEQPRILHVEGEPRWIYGFLRRAAVQDKNLRLVSLLRQADGKLLRQGVETATMLEQGFPVSKKELFGYKALILGSVEATFFSFDQLRMISEFVSQRGGGLLALGGRKSFGLGGYAGTPLADALPVALGADGGGASFRETEFKALLTPQGMGHPVTRLSLVETENAKRWTGAPSLVGLNPTGGARAGASVLLQATDAGGRADSPLLIHQRFGRGKSMALATGSTWRWRMGLDHRDDFHDVFWKQLLRWLASDVPDPVSASVSRTICSLDEGVELRAEIHDELFLPLNNAQVEATVKGPSGRVSNVPLAWDARRDGNYGGFHVPQEAGLHQVTVDVTVGGSRIGSAKASFHAGPSNAEFFGARRNESLLRRLAEETGGRYYSPEDAGTLPEDVAIVNNGASRIEERDLWDMPFAFLLLAASIAVEWWLRRKKGML